ncbi:hypothetical protein V8C86DRAFT_77996 [Haematococcus lacustris]
MTVTAGALAVLFALCCRLTTASGSSAASLPGASISCALGDDFTSVQVALINIDFRAILFSNSPVTTNGSSEIAAAMSRTRQEIDDLVEQAISGGLSPSFWTSPLGSVLFPSMRNLILQSSLAFSNVMRVSPGMTLLRDIWAGPQMMGWPRGVSRIPQNMIPIATTQLIIDSCVSSSWGAGRVNASTILSQNCLGELITSSAWFVRDYNITGCIVVPVQSLSPPPRPASPVTSHPTSRPTGCPWGPT